MFILQIFILQKNFKRPVEMHDLSLQCIIVLMLVTNSKFDISFDVKYASCNRRVMVMVTTNELKRSLDCSQPSYHRNEHNLLNKSQNDIH